MKRRFPSLIGVAIALLGLGCGQASRDAQIEAFVVGVDDDSLIQEIRSLPFEFGGGLHVQGRIPIHEDNWPNSLSGLRPKSMARDSAGIYVATYEFFMEESGLFILVNDRAGFRADSSEPSFEHISGRYFRYRIAG